MTVGAADDEQAHTCEGVAFRDCSTPSIVALISANARRLPEASAIVAASPSGDVVLSYGELEERTRRMAGWLRAEIGGGSADVVGALCHNDIPSVIGILGLLRAGYAPLLLNPSDPAARRAAQTSAVAAAVTLVASPALRDELPSALQAPELDRLGQGEAPAATITAEQPAFHFATSGSTASSKIVVQSHRNATVNARAVVRHHRLGCDDRLLVCLPVHHVNSMHFGLLATLLAGATVVLLESFDVIGYSQILARTRPRIASVTPTLLEALASAGRGVRAPHELDYFLSAAAPMAPTTARRVREHLKARVVQGYGLTEATNYSATMPVDLPEHEHRRLVEAGDWSPIGQPLDGNEMAVLTPGGTFAAAGEVGEICIRGHNVMSGYAGNPEATREAFSGGWLHSGDLGFEMTDPATARRLFVITGRRKNVAKVRGESVSLDEMDHALASMDGVLEAATVGIPDPLQGQVIAAVVAGAEQVTEPAIRALLAQTFNQAALPRHIVFVDRLPRTQTGKIQRPALAAMVERLAR